MEETTADRLEISLAVPARDGRVLVRKRGEGVHLSGLWEFPGGKIGGDEAPLTAARRELWEETGLNGGEYEPLVVHDFAYPEVSVRLYAFLVRDPEGEAQRLNDAGWTWVGLDELDRLPMPDANGPILKALRWRLAS